MFDCIFNTPLYESLSDSHDQQINMFNSLQKQPLIHFVPVFGIILILWICCRIQCVKNVYARSFSGPLFPAFGLNAGSLYSVRMRENADRKNSKADTFYSMIFYSNETRGKTEMKWVNSSFNY